MAQLSVITFDVYGTLARWNEAVERALGACLGSAGSNANVTVATNIFEAETRRLQSVGAFRSYRDILRASVAPALAVVGRTPSAADAERVLGHLGSVPPYPEVPGVLAALATRYRLCPISNTDDDLLAGTLANLGEVFATTVTAEQAQAYKPNPGLFRYALAKLGVAPEDVLHVAQGAFTDLTVCTALGLRVVWVNRTGASLQRGLDPLAVIDDLSALPEVVASL